MIIPEPSTCPHCLKAIPPSCPHCQSNALVVFNGHRGSGSQRCLCRGCNRTFTAGARGMISPATWSAADVFLAADVEVKVISQALGISRRHLYTRKAGVTR